MSKNYLVTGGAGFIGSHLCDRFLGEGHEVIVGDRHFIRLNAQDADLLRGDILTEMGAQVMVGPALSMMKSWVQVFVLPH